MKYFDMKFQVLIHGINVVEDVLNNPGNHSHHVWVFEFPLSVHNRKYNKENRLFTQYVQYFLIQTNKQQFCSWLLFFFFFYLHSVCFS